MSFDSDASAQRCTGVAKQNISKAALGIREQAGGYQWSRELVEHLPKCPKQILRKVILCNDTSVLTFSKVSDALKYLGIPHSTTLKRYADNNRPINGFTVTYEYFD
jgi:hypothetical protein